MAGFKIKSSKLNYTIYNEDDSIFKTYVLNAGDENMIKTLAKKAKTIQNNADDIEKIIDDIKFIVNTLFNNEYDIIYKQCGENVYWMIMLVADVMKEINNAGMKNINV